MSDRDLIAEGQPVGDAAGWQRLAGKWRDKGCDRLNELYVMHAVLEHALSRIAELEAAQRPPDEIEAALEYAWDDGNASGLDGWTGPGRGAGEVDKQAIYNRDRAIRTALEKLGETRRPPAGYVVLVRDAEELAIRLHRSYILHTSLDTAATAEGIASRYADFEGEYFVAEVREVQP